MKKFIIQIALLIVLIIIFFGLGVLKKATARPEPGKYNNFGISFTYPSKWGIATESLYQDRWSTNFEDSEGRSFFFAYIGTDTNPEGTEVVDESFEEMIARFKHNNPNIYDEKDIQISGIPGKEVFTKNAVSGEPYGVSAYIPLGDHKYFSFGGEYNSLKDFEKVISTIKIDPAFTLEKNSATGMFVYRNNGIQFEYPEKFNTPYASVTTVVSVKKAEDKASECNSISLHGISFCYSQSGDAAAGSMYDVRTYTTVKNGFAYKIEYTVRKPNGCGGYKNSEDENDPSNAKYNECLTSLKNSNIEEVLEQSISTFAFI